MIRVLVVEDSAVAREYLVYLLSQDPVLKVVGTAKNGLEGVEEAERLKPNVILMDVHMPRMNGFEATQEIMKRCPTPIVMVSASIRQDEVAMSFEALKAGALMLIHKPAGPDHPEHVETSRQLLEAVKLMAEVKVVQRWPRRERPVPPSPPPARLDRKIRLIAIGASTGGPQVLADLLGELPANLAAPILIVQHIALGFTAGLAAWLDHGTQLRVKLAEAGEAMQPATVYVAPNRFQMGITKEGRIRLIKDVIEDGFCPSASYLFQSVAETYGRSALGILLTGMGHDGAAGLKQLRGAGGITVAQDEESSVIFGMPQEAIRLGAAEYVLSPEQIARLIRTLVGQG